MRVKYILPLRILTSLWISTLQVVEVLILLNKIWGKRTCFIRFCILLFGTCRYLWELLKWGRKCLQSKSTTCEKYCFILVFIFNFIGSQFHHVYLSHWISQALFHFFKWKWKHFKLIWGEYFQVYLYRATIHLLLCLTTYNLYWYLFTYIYRRRSHHDWCS